MPIPDRAKEIIESAMAERFAEVEIVAVDVAPETDEDGDPILLVRIVFDAKDRQRLDPRETSSLARRVIPRLAEVGVTSFPVFSFIRKSEWRGRSPEAA